ncbi:hypothetical protein NADE_005019 [Nannochloris sp. 'desiccata']|nr:hypothetical protein NADE_005019 [Chlorella desiccata (nom. nud.)]
MLVEAVFNTGLHSAGVIFALLFTTVRVLLWAFFVVIAWYEIVEKPFEKELEERAKKPQTTDPGPVELTAAALDQHQAAEAVYKLENKGNEQQAPPASQGPGNIPRMSGHGGMADDDDDESVDRWSIWENENEVGGGGGAEQQTHLQPRTPPPARLTQEGLVAGPIPSVTGKSYPGVNVNVMRPPVQVVALDESTGGKTRSGGGGSAGKKEKKPLISRKLEKYLVAPYEKQCTNALLLIVLIAYHAGYLSVTHNTQCLVIPSPYNFPFNFLADEHVGYFLYRGINKTGIRLETSLNSLAKELDGAIRDAGVEAVNRVEVVMRRYLKFVGAVVLLTVGLMPLPSVHISLGVA